MRSSNFTFPSSITVENWPITLAFRRAISQAISCLESGLSGDIAGWREAKRHLSAFEGVFYEILIKRPYVQALLPALEGDGR